MYFQIPYRHLFRLSFSFPFPFIFLGMRHVAWVHGKIQKPETETVTARHRKGGLDTLKRMLKSVWD